MALTKAKLIELIEAGEFDEYLGGEVTKEAVEAVLTGNITSHTHDSKLDASAYTAADVLAKLLTVDGSGSGLDADSVDGTHGGYIVKIGVVDYVVDNWGNPTNITFWGAVPRLIIFSGSVAKTRGLYVITVNPVNFSVNAFPVVVGSGLTLTSPGDYKLRIAFSGGIPDVKILTLG